MIAAGELAVIVTERRKFVVRVGQRQAVAVVVAVGHCSLGDDSVLDLEQVGEVSVDLERHA